MSEPIRYTGKSGNSLLGSPHWIHPEGEWVKWDDYARLKAELRGKVMDSLSDIGQLGEQSSEIAHLKAEVARLECFCTRTIIPNEILQTEVKRLNGLLTLKHL